MSDYTHSKYTIANTVQYMQNIIGYIFIYIHLFLKAEIWDCILGNESSDTHIFLTVGKSEGVSMLPLFPKLYYKALLVYRLNFSKYC